MSEELRSHCSTDGCQSTPVPDLERGEADLSFEVYGGGADEVAFVIGLLHGRRGLVAVHHEGALRRCRPFMQIDGADPEAQRLITVMVFRCIVGRHK